MLPEKMRVYPRENDPDYKKDDFFVYDNVGLCERLGIAVPPEQYRQNYADNKVRVKVL